MGSIPVGHRAANLPWLRPADASLFALADEHPDPHVLAADPAAVLLLLRYTRPTPTVAEFGLDATAWTGSLLPEAAAGLLPTDHARLSDELVSAARRVSRLAAALAREKNACPPPAAAAAGLLASLGVLAVAAVDPRAVAERNDAVASGEDPAGAESRLWGMSASGIVRRLASRWRLPQWLTSTITNLDLTVEAATGLGADRGLFTVVREAVITAGAESTDALPAPPDTVPDHYLVRLLRTAARARRSESHERLTAALTDADALHAQLRREAERFDTRLRDAKLAAVAELAAGAGHEINNPLAVISGNAQLLLARATDPEARKSLQGIVRQSRRIADILHDLMRFARPKPPARRPFDPAAWFTNIVEECRPHAEEKGVELFAVPPPVGFRLLADPGQLGHALAAVVRNGIEAAGGGRVTVSVTHTGGVLRITVDDTGPGPTEPVALFDPFYSGRSAGRGRGLGLSVAWRLLRANGGDVRYEPTPGGPTRFVLDLPAVEPVPDRLSA